MLFLLYILLYVFMVESIYKCTLHLPTQEQKAGMCKKLFVFFNYIVSICRDTLLCHSIEKMYTSVPKNDKQNTLMYPSSYLHSEV